MEKTRSESIEAKHDERPNIDAAGLSSEPYGPPGKLPWMSSQHQRKLIYQVFGVLRLRAMLPCALPFPPLAAFFLDMST